MRAPAKGPSGHWTDEGCQDLGLEPEEGPTDEVEYHVEGCQGLGVEPEEGPTDEMEDHVEKLIESIGRRFIKRPIPYIMPSAIGHSLDSLWVCPEHVPKYGGKATHFAEDWICIMKPDDDTFPSALHSLLNLCIDDTKIWAIAYQSDLEAQERAQWMEENWPGGIPDQDWEYQ